MHIPSLHSSTRNPYITLACTLLLTFQVTAAYAQTVRADAYLQQVISHPHSRTQLAEFIDNVLYQIPSRDIFALIDTLETNNGTPLYTHLLDQIHAIEPVVPLWVQLKALQQQKKILTGQALSLLGDRRELQNCVEIGTPGTYVNSLSKHLPLSGTLYAIVDQQRPTDCLQAPSLNPKKLFRAYDIYVPLADYEPMSEASIPSNSVDLVVCFIGLHHIPQEKLYPYIESIHRILKPGGIFLLRDHDAKDAETRALVDAAHSIFNVVVNKTSTVDNQREIRNFAPISCWIECLEAHGFKAGPERFLQEGDSTLNTMIRFEKLPQTKEEQLVLLAKQLDIDAKHTHPQGDTFLPTPEWFVVDTAQEYGQFVSHTPFYRFPYFSYIAAYWKLFGQSWEAARKRDGFFTALTSESTMINTFVGVSTTLEFTAKGLLSLPIQLMYQDQEPEPLSMLLHDPSQQAINDNRLRILNQYDNDLYLVKAPRHKEFLAIARMIAGTNATIVQVSGQSEIQCKVRYKTAQHPVWHDCTCEYTWNMPTQPEYVYAAISTPVTNLTQLLAQLEHDGIELIHIHDF